MLGGEFAVLQAPVSDCLSFDPFSLFDDGLCSPEEPPARCAHCRQRNPRDEGPAAQAYRVISRLSNAFGGCLCPCQHIAHIRDLPFAAARGADAAVIERDGNSPQADNARAPDGCDCR